VVFEGRARDVVEDIAIEGRDVRRRAARRGAPETRRTSTSRCRVVPSKRALGGAADSQGDPGDDDQTVISSHAILENTYIIEESPKDSPNVEVHISGRVFRGASSAAAAGEHHCGTGEILPEQSGGIVVAAGAPCANHLNRVSAYVEDPEKEDERAPRATSDV